MRSRHMSEERERARRAEIARDARDASIRYEEKPNDGETVKDENAKQEAEHV